MQSNFQINNIVNDLKINLPLNNILCYSKKATSKLVSTELKRFIMSKHLGMMGMNASSFFGFFYF